MTRGVCHPPLYVTKHYNNTAKDENMRDLSMEALRKAAEAKAEGPEEHAAELAREGVSEEIAKKESAPPAATDRSERDHLYALDNIARYRAHQRGEHFWAPSLELEAPLDAETNEEEDLLFRTHVREGRLLELVDANIIDTKEADTLFYNHPDQYEELTSWGQEALRAWIAENIEPDERASSDDPYLPGSYSLKSLFERSERGFYIDNGQMKGAMLAAGYEPVVVGAYPTFNWQFKGRFKKTKEELDELCWVLLADLYERRRRPVPVPYWRNLAKTRARVTGEAFLALSERLEEDGHAVRIDAGWIPLYG